MMNTGPIESPVICIAIMWCMKAFKNIAMDRVAPSILDLIIGAVVSISIIVCSINNPGGMLARADVIFLTISLTIHRIWEVYLLFKIGKSKKV